jgi:hypothetical protein
MPLNGASGITMPFGMRPVDNDVAMFCLLAQI